MLDNGTMFRARAPMTNHTLSACLRVWVIVWMLAVPLFHVHPEADHRHGETGHVHGGTVHTVFSGDLDGEFSSHQRTTTTAFGVSARSSHTWQEHSEIGFSLLSDSSDRRVFKPILTQIGFMAVAVMPALESCDSAEENIVSVPSSPLFIHELPCRAPPSLFI